MSYFLSISIVNKVFLGAIRNWENLKVGFEHELIWVKDLTCQQIDTIEIKTIPYKKIYHLLGSKLFLQGTMLPERSIPSLLWTSIERALPITLPSFNHNLFNLPAKISIRLVPTDEEKDAFAVLISLKELETYMESAPAVRTKPLRWAIVNEMDAIVVGAPLLPLSGNVYWRANDFLFPAGYSLQFNLLSNLLHQTLNDDKDHWIVWDVKGYYWKLPKALLKPLSLSSSRLSSKILHGSV